MWDRLQKTWKPTGGIDLMDIGHGFFMVKFDLAADREKVIDGGPWMIFDHYLAVRPWVPDFVSSEVKIDKTLVWVRFPSLEMEYYDESVLMALAAAVGKPIRVDIQTVEATRGKFAHVCVEISLDQPVVGKVWFRNHWFNVEYEGLHLLCKKYGVFDHIAHDCMSHANSGDATNKASSEEGRGGGTDAQGQGNEKASINDNDLVTEDNIDDRDLRAMDHYGDWLTVQKGKHSHKAGDRFLSGVEENNRKSGKNIDFLGNKYSALGNKDHHYTTRRWNIWMATRTPIFMWAKGAHHTS